MGKMKELQIELMNLGRDWEEFLRRALSQTDVGRAGRMKPEESPDSEEEWEMFRWEPDLSFTPADETKPVAVEIKILRWQHDWHTWVRDAHSHLRQVVVRGPYSRGILILTKDLSDADRSRVDTSGLDGEVEVWGLSDLRKIVADDDDLAEQLEDLIADTVIDAVVERPASGSPNQGSILAAKLRSIEPGQKGWQAFEIACEEAIRFLFSAHLSNLSRQQRTNDDLNRMDLVGRIKSAGASFWSDLAADFSTRYVVFEAKNHDEPIGQQIQITEKYLMANGLRTVAIVIAREGASKSATAAAEGALRENGKFILTISRADLCTMLEGATKGDNPENRLFELMDAFLMALGR
ncbi:hypothetical protein BFX40_09280 [Mesorhizobium sp. SEMIA 3007]|uniref:hypothetical protein n=1 Tax=Mesorhizobium sp. SEMIA 3007 TaxID=1862350 RepID=UPI00083D4D48|nr:hypothetical protein [Mesorhizobium sp. SEMIA 3007]ODA93075.1 hypothetical protein BFX40_09280 [Mesorhizobium sp. SEMIA 3007]